uniref:Orc1-like AAA ATPase domain-containing protein n=1 Tax=Brassica oleracea TaxID=3712 RepID=A0A3P6FYJ7_BRAOL|nr:unnamed protein product [Brassica oleracea]
MTCFILTFGRFGRRYKTYMTKEESSKVTRRSTRSSLTVTNPMNPNPPLPTVNDLTYGQESITLDALLSNFPGRRSQILDLIRLIGPLDSPTLPIIIYGDASAGKTGVVLQVFRHLNRPFVYSTCPSSKRCDKPSDFVNLLKQALRPMGKTVGLPPDVYYSNMGYTDPLPVYFPDVVLRPFCRVTRRVEELSTTFSLLFRKYCEPLDDLGVSPNEDLKSHLKPHIALCLNVVFRVSSHSHDVTPEARGGGKLAIVLRRVKSWRNPATLDASMFDSTGGMDNRKRKRKASEKSMEKKEIAEQEAAMKGPGSFPLERLLAIFQCIASIGDSSFNEEKKKLLSGRCPLEGSVRYRSMVSEDLSLQVARSLSFPLSKYLYRR